MRRRLEVILACCQLIPNLKYLAVQIMYADGIPHTSARRRVGEGGCAGLAKSRDSSRHTRYVWYERRRGDLGLQQRNPPSTAIELIGGFERCVTFA